MSFNHFIPKDSVLRLYVVTSSEISFSEILYREVFNTYPLYLADLSPFWKGAFN